MKEFELAEIIVYIDKIEDSKTSLYYEGRVTKNRYGVNQELIGNICKKDDLSEALDLLAGTDHIKNLISTNISKKFKTERVIVIYEKTPIFK